MEDYCFKYNNETYALATKEEYLHEGLQYTQSGNNITVTSYTGTDTDVVVLNRIINYFPFVLPDN